MLQPGDILNRAEREIIKARGELEALAQSLLSFDDKDPLGLLQQRNAGIPAAASLKVWREVSTLVEMEQSRGRAPAEIHAAVLETSTTNATGLDRKDVLRRSTNPVTNLCEDLERSVWAAVFYFLTTGR
jgi:hypothetical protein